MDPHPSGLTSSELWLRWQRYPYVLAKALTFLLVGGGIFVALRAVGDVLAPVLAAMFLAYLLDPSVDRFEARGWSRTTGIFAILVLGGLFVALFLLFLYPTVAHLTKRIAEGVPALVDLIGTQALPWLERNLGVRAPASVDGLVEEYGDTLRAQVPDLFNRVTAALGSVWTRTGAIVASLLNLVLIPVLTFYFLRDFDHLRLGAVDYLPAWNRDWVLERIHRMDEVVGAWFRGQVEVATILAGLYAAGLGLTFGVAGIGFTSGVAIGILAGLLNIVPYFGFLIGFVLSVLLAIVDWAGWGPLVGVLLTFAVVQALEGYVITPRVVGEKVGLSAPVVIVALLLGGHLLGFVGVLLALPIAGIVRVLLPDAVAWYRASSLYTGDVPAEAVVPGPQPTKKEGA